MGAFLESGDEFGVARAALGAAETAARLERWRDSFSWSLLSLRSASAANQADWVEHALGAVANSACGVGDRVRAEDTALGRDLYSFAIDCYRLLGDERGEGRAHFGLAVALAAGGSAVDALEALLCSLDRLGDEPAWLRAIALEAVKATPPMADRHADAAGLALWSRLVDLTEGGSDGLVRMTALAGWALAGARPGEDPGPALAVALDSVASVETGHVAQLVRIAHLLYVRGLNEAAAAFLVRAVDLTPDADRGPLRTEFSQQLSGGRASDPRTPYCRSAARWAGPYRFGDSSTFDEVNTIMAAAAVRRQITPSDRRAMVEALERAAAREVNYPRRLALEIGSQWASTLNDYETAVRLADLAVRDSNMADCPSCTFSARCALGNVHDYWGDTSGARLTWEAAINAARDASFPESLDCRAAAVGVMCDVGELFLAEGNVERARQYLNAASSELTESLVMCWPSVKVSRFAARFYLRSNELDDAASHISHALTRNDWLERYTTSEALKGSAGWRLAASIACARSDFVDGLTMASKAVAIHIRSGPETSRSCASSHDIRGFCHFRMGSYSFAKHDLNHAIREARACDALEVEAQASETLADILALEGDDEYLVWLVEAARLRVVERVRASDPADRFRFSQVHAGSLAGRLRHLADKGRADVAAMIVELDRVFGSSEFLRTGLPAELVAVSNGLLASHPRPQPDDGGGSDGQANRLGVSEAQRSEMVALMSRHFGNLVDVVDPEPDPSWVERGVWDWLLTFHVTLPTADSAAGAIQAIAVARDGTAAMHAGAGSDLASSTLGQLVGQFPAEGEPTRGLEEVPRCLRVSNDEAWAAVADLLLPPVLRAELLKAARRGRIIRLQICPSGPLWGVPWAALPVGNGVRVLDGACVTLSANGKLAAELARRGPKPTGRTVLARNGDMAGVEEVAASTGPHTLAKDLTQLRRELGSEVATLVLLAHGDEAPGLLQSVDFGAWRLSAAELASLPLPLDVRLAACSSGASVWLPGLEPLGLAFAAHVGGARWVTTCAWPIPQAALAALLSAMAGEPSDPPMALRAAQLKYLARNPSAKLWEWATTAVHGG